MSIFRLALRYMKRQKRRVILTAVGIVLAVALVSGSGILITSFLDMKLTQSEKSDGTWHYRVTVKTDADRASMLRGNVLVKAAGLSADDVSLQIPSAKGNGKSAPGEHNGITLNEYDSTALSMMPYTVIKGRMPQNGSEIMLTQDTASRFPDGVKTGDRLTLPARILTDPGSSDSFKEAGTRTFTVVGIYKSGIYDWQSEGAQAVTLNPTGTRQYHIYVQMKPGVDFPSSIKKAAKDCGFGSADIRENDIVEWMGKSSSTKVRDAVVATFLILAAIILGVTALIIRNSFAMSVSEKISQIGMLRCLGASPVQIRGLVFSEALCIWAAALPVGFLGGVGAMAGVIGTVRRIDPDDLAYLRLTASAWPFAAAAVLSLAAILLSAHSPVRATMKVPMIEAVRGNATYRGNEARKNRKGRILGRLFGFPGLLAAKNIRRNPKQFRTTLVSVIVSVLLFLSVGGFFLSVGSSIRRGVEYYSGTDYKFQTNREEGKNGQNEEQIQKIKSLENRIRALPTVESTQETSCYDNLALNVPVSRIPEKYAEAYQNFQAQGRPFSQSLSTDNKGGKYLMRQLKVLEVSRENYGSLKFSGKAPTYDELLAGKGALLYQTETMISSGGRMATADFSDYKPGESLSVLQNYQLKESGSDGAPEAKDRTLNIRLMGVLSEPPWFAFGSDGYLIVAQGNSGVFSTSGLKDADEQEDEMQFLLVRYLHGAEEEADAQMKQFETSARAADLVTNDVYHENLTERNSLLIMKIFIVGFATVIILISCINVFNTIHANLQNRKKEIAMIRAVGMGRKQLYHMLLLECALYGLTGTFWGAVIGLPLQAWMLHAFGYITLADMQSPLLLVLISLLISVGLGVLAGWSSIRRMAKAPLVEEIRSEE